MISIMKRLMWMERPPIVLSAAIFLSPDVHDKRVKAKGCGLINHFTITANYQCPTHVSNRLSQEGALAATHYIFDRV